ncbi:MAG TPA: class I SAM-dependent methyltransferase [Thermomicrobiales bacterium]|nr:class I SAM-dependent methyltransferase [Thermomicrobiales bacterium]
MRFSPPYSAYARIYDRIGQRAFGERMAAVILRELSDREVFPRTVLDLGCGTGAATLAFARAGLDATGLDLSPDMLTRAREFAKVESLDVAFIEGDMTALRLPNRFELATCIYDAVNYLENETALQQLFQAAHGLLEPGGAFAFDMNTRSRLERSWEQGLILAGDSDDLYATYRSWYDAALDASPLIVTAFMRNPDRTWTRFDEEHIERAWPIADVTVWLQHTGFHVEQVTGYADATGDLVRPAREDHGRVLFLATR